MKIGILGGGLSGLSMGYHLNTDFEILEKNNECGGLCRSLQSDGFTFDYGGSHIIFSKDQEVLDFMLSVLGNNKFRNRRNTKVFFKGNYIKYPFENGLNELPKQDNFECLYHYIDILLKKEKGEIGPPKNFKEWIYYTFGKGIAEKYMIPYNEKIWNIKCELMNHEWVKERIPQPPMEDIIKSSIGISTEGYKHQLHFYYPKYGGIQAVIESIEEKIKNRITCNFDINSIKEEDSGWIISDGRNSKVFDKIVSTIPIFDLANALKSVPLEITNAVNNLKYNSLITVMIGVDILKINDLSWVYLPTDEEGKANRLSFPSNFSKYAAPQGKSSLLAEITCFGEDEIWSQTDEEITNVIVNDLHRIGIIHKENVCFTEVRRFKYAYIIYDLDYYKNMTIITNYFKNIGITLCGRFSEFKYLNMDACIRSAINKANELNRFTNT